MTARPAVSDDAAPRGVVLAVLIAGGTVDSLARLLAEGLPVALLDVQHAIPPAVQTRDGAGCENCGLAAEVGCADR